MNLARFFLSLVILSYSVEIFAQRKEIREVDTNDHLMKVVNLTMGRSTVLSFQEKPVKVISGNSNYFNVEFVGNDLTLQPLAPVETNLFVYTEKGTKFGFLLKVGPVYLYDDILYIRWKTQSEILMKSMKPQKNLQSFKIRVKDLEVSVKKFSRLGDMKTYFFDLEVKNRSSANIKPSSVEIFVNRTGQHFIGQKLVWEKDEINPRGSSRARLIVRIEQAQPFSLTIRMKGKEAKTIITKDYL